MATDQDFGPWFRSRRKAMGLSLREFCRRNGYDAANISRLERGLVPPPQSHQILESYAKALKVERDTAEWAGFFSKAAIGAGRIPEEFLEGRPKAETLPRLYRQLLPKRAVWVSGLHLESWADTLDARRSLPRVVRRLIRATGKGLRRIDFPAGEQVQRPDWDGMVEAGAGDVFVPAGSSVWEMGVDRDPRKKAEEDFAKRTKGPLGLDPKQTTFVFVTPRKWLKKDEWQQAKAKLGVWRDVRVYDSATLEEWLEQAPPVDAWLAGILGIRPGGLAVLDDYWANLQALTVPSLKPGVFLASREEQIKGLETWLKGPNRGAEPLGRSGEEWLENAPGVLVIESRSPAEVIDFVAAYAQDASQTDLFAARTMIIESRDAWKEMAALSHGELLLIPHPSLSIEPELVAEAVRHGHRVILGSASPPREPVESLKLPRAYRYDLEAALKESGFDEEWARQRAREAGGSLTVLKRLLARYPGTTQPDWSRPPESAELVPFLLAGSWDGEGEADRSAMERLSGRPYRELAELAARCARPLIRSFRRPASAGASSRGTMPGTCSVTPRRPMTCAGSRRSPSKCSPRTIRHSNCRLRSDGRPDFGGTAPDIPRRSDRGWPRRWRCWERGRDA